MKDLVAEALRDQVKRLDLTIKFKRDNLSDWIQISNKTSKELEDLVRTRRAIIDHLEINGEEEPAPQEPRVWDQLDDVPKRVRVRSAGGQVWRYWLPGEIHEMGHVVSSAGGWFYNRGEGFDTSTYKSAPFTEVLEEK